MQDAIYLTKEGLEKLKKELAELRDVKVPEVAKRIQVARDNGDISENAEYDAAKHEQAVIEGKIKELEDILKNAVVTEEKKSDKVSVGSKVKLHIDGQDVEFHIVGPVEADPMNKKISHESPMGSALLGKKVGEKIDVEAPMGKITYTVVEIK